MQIAFRTFKRDFRTGISIHFLILLIVSGVLNTRASILYADELHAHPGSIVFNAVSGHPLDLTRSIFIFTSDGTTLGWSDSKDAAWLTTDLSSGSTDGVLKVGVNTTGLTPGIYHGNITIQSPESEADPIIISATLIVNPDVTVKITPWKDGYGSAMTVSVDDAEDSGFEDLHANGFSGTYVTWGTVPPSFYTDYYNAGMELGCHTVNHPCSSRTDDELRYDELEPNILGISTYTPEPAKDIISLVWPCGYTNYREQAVATDYFLSARGYNINLLEDADPDNFMNLKSFNSHEHYPYPPEDLRTVVDAAISQKKWFNLVLHTSSNDDGATNYAHSKDIWVTSIGTIIKYIMQRQRFILADYNITSDNITFNVSRLAVLPSPLRTFEPAFGPNDMITMQIEIDDTRAVEYVSIDGVKNPYQAKDVNGKKVLLVNVRVESSGFKAIEVKYLNQSSIGLTISGVSADDKEYDGTTSATLNTGTAALVGKLPGDVVTLLTTGANGSFTNKTAGTSKTILTSGFALSGPDAGKYSLIMPVLAADITRATLTISGITANDKVYDGTTAADINTESGSLEGVLGTDDVTLISTGAVGSFEDNEAGNGKLVSVGGFTLGGADRSNYTLTQPETTADISRAELTISSVTANNKVYDGTTSASLNTASASLNGTIGSDDVVLVVTGASGSFEDASVGVNKLVYTAGFLLEGSDSDNYTLIQPTTTGSITGILLTITGVTANNKVYNRTTTATLNTGSAALLGVLGGDNVTLISTGATGTFVNRNAGTGKSVTTSGFTLGGTDKARYTLIQPSASADITKADLTISGVIANNKVYNGTMATSLNTGSAVLMGIFSGDVVTLVSSGATGSFANKNVGTGKAVTTSGFTTGGADAGNYNVVQPSLSANITKSTLTVSGITTINKVYDATTSATLNTGSESLAGIFGTDAVTLNSAGSTGTFANKNAGIGKSVTISGFTISGADADNYSLTQPTSTGDITKASATISGVIANSRIYNATNSATLNTGSSTLAGVITGDIVSLVSAGATGTFENKNAGQGKVVTTTGFTIAGTDAANYNLIQPSVSASITRASLAVTGATVSNKVYDGTTAAAINTGSATLSGVLAGDVISLNSSGAIGTFASKNAGTGISVSASGFSGSGADRDNYTIVQPTLSANISAKGLTVIAKDLTKSYRTTLTFTISDYALEGLVAGDAVSGITLSSPGAVASAPVGTYAISASGGSNNNYTFTYIYGNLTVMKSVLIVRADDKTKVYGTANPPLTISYSGFLNNEDQSVLNVLPVISTTALGTSNAGLYPITLSGGSDDNYSLTLVNGNMVISKATLTISAENKTRTFGCTNPDFSFTYSGFVSGEDQSDLEALPDVYTDADINSDAGAYDISVSGAAALNYSFIYNTGTLTIGKADQQITFTEIPDGLRMTQETHLIATSSSGLEVSFELDDPEAGSLNANVLTVRKDGELVVRAKQAGNKNWNPAPEVAQSFVTLPTFDGISSLFTPNNDGINDYWYIPDLARYGKLQVTVYNRFGQCVYRSDSYRNNWEGTWNGNPLPSASYYYIIKSSSKGYIKGVVNIVR
jgi:gliding motility-associated-like protein